MAELNVRDASLRVGVPPGVLSTWAFDKRGPQNSGSIWVPLYKTEHLDAWLAEHRETMARSIG